MLSLCIPTKNRWNFLKINLPIYLDNPYIEEIIITDENGEDSEEIQKVYKDNDKIKVFINDKVLGAYLNKRKCVSLAKNDWVCLMDSDNFAPLSYFEAWNTCIKDNKLNNDFIYAPWRTIPQQSHPGFDYMKFTEEYNFEKCKELFDKNPFYENQNIFKCMLNTGNYIINKEIYNFCFTDENLKHVEDNCKGLDVLFQNYLLLTKGNCKLVLVPNMEYHHIVHSGSYYLQTCDYTDHELVYNLYR